MHKQLKPGQLCTINRSVYRCSKRTMFPCAFCRRYYFRTYHRKAPCDCADISGAKCIDLFGGTGHIRNSDSSISLLLASYPILVK